LSISCFFYGNSPFENCQFKVKVKAEVKENPSIFVFFPHNLFFSSTSTFFSSSSTSLK
jgi:hypothetical protein